MDDQGKNLILATVLSFLVILAWYTLFPPPVDQTVEETPATVTTTEGATTPPATAGADAPATTATGAADTATASALAAAPRLPIDTPRLAGSLSLLGGRIDDLSLKDYKVSLDPGAANIRLLAPIGVDEPPVVDNYGRAYPIQPYYAVYGWSPAGGLDAKLVPDARTLWTVESGSSLAPAKPVTLRWDNGAGLVFRRVIEVDADYLFTVTQSVENQTAAAVRLAPYGIVARHGTPVTQNNWILHEGVVRLSDGELEEIDYPDMPDLDTVQREGTPASVIDIASDGWIGFTDRYWMTAQLPAPGAPFTSVVKYVPGADVYQTEARLAPLDVAPGTTAEAKMMLYAGAKEWDAIRGYQTEQGVKGFVDSIDWGWFFFLTKPMFMLLHWLHGAIGNMGWAIIALTITIKTIVFPLARKSYVSMARMKELQPEMEKLKERVGDDRQKMQVEMMALYKREKVNPASGCLPILIQIPIFFSLYKVIVVTIELYHQPWFGWIRDLSAPDPSSVLNLFGLLPYATPQPGSIFFIVSLGVLPIILGITMWFQQKLNPAPTDATQAAIFAWMPWIFMFMMGSFASGLIIYWIANNTITFAQQYTIMSMHGKRPDLFGNIREGFKRKKPADETPKK